MYFRKKGSSWLCSWPELGVACVLMAAVLEKPARGRGDHLELFGGGRLLRLRAVAFGSRRVQPGQVVLFRGVYVQLAAHQRVPGAAILRADEVPDVPLI